MKQKGLQEFQTIIYRILSLFTVFQIGFGILWALCNMGSVQGFSETKELLEISETLVTDEYVGILYPVIIRLLRAVEGILPVPYYCFLYVMQLGAGYFAVYRLLKELHCPHVGRSALWIMTIPTVLQLHMAVLPQSLAASFLILCLVGCVRKEWIRGGIYGLLCGLLIPEYLLFAGILYLLNLIRGFLCRDCRKAASGKGLVCFILVCLTVAVVTSASCQTYSRGRMARTPAAMALQRLVWPHYSTNSYFWNVYVTDLFDEEDLWNLAQDPELPVREFGPAIEQAYGLKQAQTIYWYMAQVTFQMRTKEILFDILNDLILYSIPTAVLPRNLEGLGVSYSGWNYGRMAQRAPVLTRFYVLYAGNVTGIMLLLILLKKLAERLEACKRTVREKKKRPMGKLTMGKLTMGKLTAVEYLLLCILQILWYTMSASGMQDYRNVILVSIGWGILIAMGVSGGKKLYKESEEC